MRVLVISLDRELLKDGSAVQKRMSALAEQAGEIAVLIPGERDEQKSITAHLRLYALGGIKPVQWWRMWRTAQKLLTSNSKLSTDGDLITVQDTYFLALLGYVLSRRFKISLEIQVHGLEKFSGIRKWIASFVLRRAHKIRVVSERLKHFLTDNLQLTTDRIYILPVYVQNKPLTINHSPVTHPKEKKETPFTFLTVGRLVTIKNIEMQIHAFSKLISEFPDIRLVVVGEGPLSKSLKFKVKSLKLEDTIRFEGMQKDLSEYYRTADVLLLTSHQEGWGRVVIEAATYGLPAIMTDVGLAGEFMRNFEEGIVIPVGDEAALVSAMKRLLTDMPLRTRLGERAREAALRLPRPEAYIQQQIALWKSLI